MTPDGSRGPARPAPWGTLHALDASDRCRSYVLECDSGVAIRLSELAHRVVTAVWSGLNFEQTARTCGGDDGRLTAGDVERLYARVAREVAAAEDRRRARGTTQGFIARVTLVPAPLVARVARLFAPLFAPALALPCAALIAGAALYWFAVRADVPPHVDSGAMLAGYGLFIASCLVHELGHAGACVRFGVRPGPIGIALYLLFPVFYSDVTRIWRLTRRQRVIVDTGGAYLQGLCAAGYALVYAHTHGAALFVALGLIGAATLLNLNPLFRFDGYWIVADALGVAGLIPHAARRFQRLARRLRGARDAFEPSPWPAHIGAAVFAYGVAMLAFWLWLAWGLAAYAFDPQRGVAAVVSLAARHGAWTSFAFAGGLAAICAVIVTLVYCASALVRFVRAVLRPSGAPTSLAGCRDISAGDDSGGAGQRDELGPGTRAELPI